MCNHCDCDKGQDVFRDLSRFGFRELKVAAELLTAYTTNRPDWLGDGVAVWMNSKSGNVFLCDEDFNTAMMNGDKLEQWHNCPNCGHEGFAEDVHKRVDVTFDGEPDGAEILCTSCDYVIDHVRD